MLNVSRLADYANSVYEASSETEIQASLNLITGAGRKLGQMLQTSLQQRYALTIMPSHNYIHMLLIKNQDPAKDPVYPLSIEICRMDDHFATPVLQLDIKSSSGNLPAGMKRRTETWRAFQPSEAASIFLTIQESVLAQLEPQERSTFETFREKLFEGTPYSNSNKRPN